MKLITRKEYMKNSSELHNAYYAQFATEQTKQFILNNKELVHKIKKSKCPHLNDTAKHGNGGRSWIWDFSPINLSLAIEAGEVTKGYYPSPSTHTCIGKACAKLMLKNGEL